MVKEGIKQTKQCSDCKVTKTVKNFGFNTLAKDGYNYRCKECDSKRCKEYRDRVTTKVLSRRQREQIPEKIRAIRRVQAAVRRGSLKKKPCFFCGSFELLEAHHIFYDEPLKVLWLCRPHHKKFHIIWKAL